MIEWEKIKTLIDSLSKAERILLAKNPPGAKVLTREQFLAAHKKAFLKVCQDITDGYKGEGNRFPGYLADELFGEEVGE